MIYKNIVTLTAITVALAACGGGSDNDDNTVTPTVTTPDPVVDPVVVTDPVVDPENPMLPVVTPDAGVDVALGQQGNWFSSAGVNDIGIFTGNVSSTNVPIADQNVDDILFDFVCPIDTPDLGVSLTFNAPVPPDGNFVYVTEAALGRGEAPTSGFIVEGTNTFVIPPANVTALLPDLIAGSNFNIGYDLNGVEQFFFVDTQDFSSAFARVCTFHTETFMTVDPIPVITTPAVLVEQ